MPVRLQDSRRQGVASVTQKDGSRFHARSAPDWTRKPATRWSRLTDNLIFAGILAMGGWLILASVEPSPGDPAVSTDEFVDRCLSKVLSIRNCHLDAKEPPESRSPQAIEDFKQGPLYAHILRHAIQFERKRNAISIRNDYVEEEINVVNFLGRQEVEITDPDFIEGLHQTPAGRWILERSPVGMSSERGPAIVVPYARILTRFSSFRVLKDMRRIRQIPSRP